jgi:PST family polysaccharide transporter
MGWTLSSRIVAAVLQMAILVLLARGLTPSAFAFVSSVNVALMVACALNGFGIQRQLAYRRSRNPDDELLGSLFARRLRYTYASAVLWLGATVALGLSTDPRFLAVAPAALWLVAEQITQTWNTVAIVDGRASQLMSSFLFRRVPVIVLVAVALVRDWDVVWTWSIGLALGAVLAYLFNYRQQPSWASVLLPRRRLISGRSTLDLGYWWSQVGEQLRDMDVPLLALVNPSVAGVYALPVRFVRPMNMVTLATGSVAFPMLSRREKFARRHVLVGVAAGSAPTVLIAALLFLAAPLLPVIAGSAYQDSVATMRVICLGTVLWAPSSLLVIFLQSRSDAATRLAGSIVISFNVLQLIGVMVGGAAAGATGAAAFLAVGQGFALAPLLAAAMHHAGSRPEQEPVPLAGRHGGSGESRAVGA